MLFALVLTIIFISLITTTSFSSDISIRNSELGVQNSVSQIPHIDSLLIQCPKSKAVNAGGI